MKYYPVKCFWCGKEYDQRQDTHDRQMVKYGHTCCKRCFGNEPSFRVAQKARTDKRGYPCTPEIRRKLSIARMGKPSWNTGLTKDADDRVMANASATSLTKRLNPARGDKNPNWKGGAAWVKRPLKSIEWGSWKRFREYILSEDVHSCYKCSKSFPASQLEVHHLASAKKFPYLIFERSNCVVLCKKCHKKFHSEFGIIHFTPIDFLTFINRDREAHNHFKLHC